MERVVHRCIELLHASRARIFLEELTNSLTETFDEGTHAGDEGETDADKRANQTGRRDHKICRAYRRPHHKTRIERVVRFTRDCDVISVRLKELLRPKDGIVHSKVSVGLLPDLDWTVHELWHEIHVGRRDHVLVGHETSD